ncbi:hypothetical protein ACJ41O_015348 [Fusarium nematophilum]
MGDSYEMQCPGDQSVDPEIIDFLKSFYRVSDTPGETDRYLEMFVPDATFILASKKASGHAEIRPMREGMWDSVVSRKHQIFKVFPFGKGSNEVMLYGTVALQLKNGNAASIEWAARAEFAKSTSGEYKFQFYQVYLDTGSTAAYKK